MTTHPDAVKFYSRTPIARDDAVAGLVQAACLCVRTILLTAVTVGLLALILGPFVVGALAYLLVSAP